MAKRDNKRRYPRVRFRKGMVVAWQTERGRTVSPVGTVGLGGLFIEEKEPPPVGATLRLLFDVPGGEVRARAIVRHVQPGEGMGVEFVHMRIEDRARFSQFIKKLLR